VPEAPAERLLGSHHPQREVLQVPRHAHSPALVAEMALDLAEDRGDGVAGQARVAVGVEAVDRLHQAQRSHLHEVVGRLVDGAVALGEPDGERHVAHDQPVTGGDVAFAAEALEQGAVRFVLARPGTAAVRSRFRDASRTSVACDTPRHGPSQRLANMSAGQVGRTPERGGVLGRSGGYGTSGGGG
jgi:hypothetical protein